MSRHVHELEVVAREARIEELERERGYWRTRAEKLMDASLARAGAIHEPTMHARPVPSGLDPASQIASALAILEIDTRQHKKAG